MITKLLPLIIKNMFRSKTRLVATIGGCLISALIICFLLTAQNSLARVTQSAGDNQNLVMMQKDRY
ncbi:MAG: hypothetical protein GY794_17440 [bacterium]|nr:hypothetical protein [bacterium]